MNGLTGEAEEKATSNPSVIKIMIGGMSHHFFSFHRN